MTIATGRLHHAAEALGNGDPAAHTEGAGGDLQAGRGLAALVFAEGDLVEHVASL